jgi:hypothetical protein
MGFLNGSTNNLILDAVLTDTGRKFLARNDGSFSIVKFALGDDEVDYTLIQKFGQSVGMEKIEKNTPIFEGLTNQGYAQKYKLISISNPSLLRIPNLALTGQDGNDTSTLINLGSVTARQKTLVVSQAIQNETSIDVELRDEHFSVQMNNMFIQMTGWTPDNIDSQQKATYLVPRDANTTALGGSKLTLGLRVKSVTDTQFAIYGAPQNKTIINTYVKVTGVNSGCVLEFAVRLTKGA